MEKKTFVIAGLLGRGLRFGLEAVVVGIWGDKFVHVLEWMIEYEWVTLLIILFCILLVIPLWKWWEGLATPIEEE